MSRLPRALRGPAHAPNGGLLAPPPLGIVALYAHLALLWILLCLVYVLPDHADPTVAEATHAFAPTYVTGVTVMTAFFHVLHARQARTCCCVATRRQTVVDASMLPGVRVEVASAETAMETGGSR